MVPFVSPCRYGTILEVPVKILFLIGDPFSGLFSLKPFKRYESDNGSEKPGSIMIGIIVLKDRGLTGPPDSASAVPSLPAVSLRNGITTTLVGAISLVMSPVVSWKDPKKGRLIPPRARKETATTPRRLNTANADRFLAILLRKVPAVS